MTPGTYLRLCRERAGMSIDDLALCTDTNLKVSARSRADLIALIERDTAVISADFVDALSDLRRMRILGFDRHILIILIAIHAGATIAMPAICRSCGCSWNDACGTGCSWATADHDWCTACAERAVDAVVSTSAAA